MPNHFQKWVLVLLESDGKVPTASGNVPNFSVKRSLSMVRDERETVYFKQCFKTKHKYTHTFKHHGLVHSSMCTPSHTLPNLNVELTNKNANNGCLSMVKSHKGPFYYFPSSLKRSWAPSCVCVCVVTAKEFSHHYYSESHAAASRSL